MALKLTTTAPTGFEAVDAYHRVENPRIENKTTLLFQVRSYKAATGFPSFSDEGHECAYDLNGANPYVQAYVYVKSLDDFADAVDV